MMRQKTKLFYTTPLFFNGQTGSNPARPKIRKNQQQCFVIFKINSKFVTETNVNNYVKKEK